MRRLAIAAPRGSGEHLAHRRFASAADLRRRKRRRRARSASPRTTDAATAGSQRPVASMRRDPVEGNRYSGARVDRRMVSTSREPGGRSPAPPAAGRPAQQQWTAPRASRVGERTCSASAYASRTAGCGSAREHLEQQLVEVEARTRAEPPGSGIPPRHSAFMSVLSSPPPAHDSEWLERLQEAAELGARRRFAPRATIATRPSGRRRTPRRSGSSRDTGRRAGRTPARRRRSTARGHPSVVVTEARERRVGGRPTWRFTRTHT